MGTGLFIYLRCVNINTKGSEYTAINTMNLSQLAIDMRALGSMLIAQADEIDTTMGGIDLGALASLIGGLQKLGGGEPVKVPPFRRRTTAQPPDLRELPVSPPAKKVQMTIDQKRAIREHYAKLQPKDQTIQSRRVLAQAYGITPVHLSAILVHTSMDKALAAKRAKRISALTGPGIQRTA
jgi:hypothetical protein